MTQEEKAKTYDVAKCIMEKYLKSGNAGVIAENTIKNAFPELKEGEDEKIRKALIKYFNEQCDWYDVYGYQVVSWLEKQGEQKSADKVKPKFKAGDWVVNNDDSCICQIKSIREDDYCLWPLDSEVEGYLKITDIDNKYHLWTIQDAKEGDVVVDKSDGTIGIFESIGHHPDGGSYNDPSYCFLHCRYDDGFFYADFENGNTIDSDDLIPATKEQRDLLFAKMTESGYKWDAEKKESKKIEDESENYKQHLMNEMFDLVKDYIRKKSAWSEEDEKNLICIRDGDGHSARIICYDRKCTNYPIVVLIDFESDGESIAAYKVNGKFIAEEKHEEHYDISNFKPFDKVLVRDDVKGKWKCSFFNHYSNDGTFPFKMIETIYRQCIPYNEETAHLIGTTDMPPKKYINW